jgi:3-methyladenine DNA glycosylase AlkD
MSARARAIVDELTEAARPELRDELAEPNPRLGVTTRDVFRIAKENLDVGDRELAELLDSKWHEPRVAGVSIMDFLARSRKTPADRRKALYDLYLGHHRSINSWEMVDRAAPYVVGGYLFDKPRAPLYALAESTQPMERRTAIVATYYFVRQGQIDDTFRLAELLVADDHYYVQLAVGSWVREAGKRDRQRLVAFVERHARTLTARMFAYATEKLTARERAALRALRSQ